MTDRRLTYATQISDAEPQKRRSRKATRQPLTSKSDVDKQTDMHAIRYAQGSVHIDMTEGMALWEVMQRRRAGSRSGTRLSKRLHQVLISWFEAYCILDPN
jgi:hypothetical protein